MKKSPQLVRLLFEHIKRMPQSSLRERARELDVSKDTVARLLKTAQSKSLTYAEVELMDDDELCRKFSLAGERGRWTAVPNFDAVHQFLCGKRQFKVKRTIEEAWRILYIKPNFGNITVKVSGGDLPAGCMSYSTFVRRYALWRSYHPVFDITLKPLASGLVLYSPGGQVLIDGSGDPIDCADINGRLFKMILYVAVLAYSGLTFAYLASDKTTASWLRFIMAALEYFGGSPASIKSDNDTALVKRIPLNKKLNGETIYIQQPHSSVRFFAKQYGMEWVLTGTYKAKHKALCERMVGEFQQVKGKVLGRPEPILVKSEAQINALLLEDVETFNNKKLSNRNFSRRAFFDLYEKDSLVLLPMHPQIPVNVEERTVQANGYIRYSFNNYFVKKEYAGKAVSVMRFSNDIIEIRDFFNNKLLQTYQLSKEVSPRVLNIKHSKDYEPDERWRDMGLDDFIALAQTRGFDSKMLELIAEIFTNIHKEAVLPKIDKNLICHRLLAYCEDFYAGQRDDLKQALKAIIKHGDFNNNVIIDTLTIYLSSEKDPLRKRRSVSRKAFLEAAKESDHNPGLISADAFAQRLNLEVE